MRKIKMKQIIVNNIPIIGSLVFLSIILTPPSITNLFFYSIHDTLFREIIDESIFIAIGDIILAFLFYLAIKKLLLFLLPSSHEIKSSESQNA